MPSGAKKRKAAKKKKEQEANINNNNNSYNTTSSATNTNNSPLGNDDYKSHDERESDGGEVNSPASQDHHNHQHPFKEGNEEPKKRDSSPGRSFDSENKPMDEVVRELEGKEKLGVEYDGAIKIEKELKLEELGSENISIKYVEEPHDSSSSSSSSDNESEDVEKTLKKDANVSHNGETKPVASFPKKEIQGTENASFGEADNSFVETAPVGDLVKPLEVVSEEVINVTQGELAENLVVSDLVESRLKENESKRNEEKISTSLEENVGASAAVVEIVASGNEGKVLPTSGAPTTKSSNGAEHIRDSKIPDSSENQPLIASAPRVEQRTSWMSCCGLFDVLVGSGDNSRKNA